MQNKEGQSISGFYTRELPNFCDTTYAACTACAQSDFFESGTIKTQNYLGENLATLKKRMVRLLLFDGANGVEVNAVSTGIVERALKRLHTFTTTKKSDYIDTVYLNPMSNCCEIMFSISDHTFSTCGRRILPTHLENQCFMYKNDNYWGIDHVKVTDSGLADTKSSRH